MSFEKRNEEGVKKRRGKMTGLRESVGERRGEQGEKKKYDLSLI